MDYINKIMTVATGFLVCAMLTLLGLNFANTLFHWWPIYLDQIKPSDKFEIYRDLLLILLATLGIVGYFAYKQTRSKLEEDLKKSLGESSNLILGRLYGQLSNTHWREYENMNPGDVRYQELCNLAIEEAETALFYYQSLDNKKYKTKSKAAAQKMNLAYNLAVRRQPDDRDTALRLARDNWMEAAQFAPDQEYNIRETLAFVILKFSDKDEDKQAAQEEIQRLMEWTSIPKPWKDKIKQKYLREFAISLELT